MNRFAFNLLELRKSSGLTQQELADRLGISRSAIGNYEKGIREPDLETLEKIADFFNLVKSQSFYPLFMRIFGISATPSAT